MTRWQVLWLVWLLLICGFVGWFDSRVPPRYHGRHREADCPCVYWQFAMWSRVRGHTFWPILQRYAEHRTKLAGRAE